MTVKEAGPKKYFLQVLHEDDIIKGNYPEIKIVSKP